MIFTIAKKNRILGVLEIEHRKLGQIWAKNQGKTEVGVLCLS